MDDPIVKKAAVLRELAESQSAALAPASAKATATVAMVRDLSYLVSQLAVLLETMAKQP